MFYRTTPKLIKPITPAEIDVTLNGFLLIQQFIQNIEDFQCDTTEVLRIIINKTKISYPAEIRPLRFPFQPVPWKLTRQSRRYGQ